MTDSMTTTLYVVVLAGWFGLMCIVLRCCSTDEDQFQLQDHHEVDLSVLFNGLQPKPATTAVVQGQPAKFARVQALGTANAEAESRSDLPGALEEGKVGLDQLEMPAATGAISAGPPLPSAQEVWSPILAVRTLVEPLSSRASAVFRHFHVSFFDCSDEAGESGRVGGVAVATAAMIGDTSSPPMVAAAEVAAVDECAPGDTGACDSRPERARRRGEQSAPRNSWAGATAIVQLDPPRGTGVGEPVGGCGRVILEGGLPLEEGKCMEEDGVADNDFERRNAL